MLTYGHVHVDPKPVDANGTLFFTDSNYFRAVGLSFTPEPVQCQQRLGRLLAVAHSPQTYSALWHMAWNDLKSHIQYIGEF
jgi:hypothetical protein